MCIYLSVCITHAFFKSEWQIINAANSVSCNCQKSVESAPPLQLHGHRRHRRRHVQSGEGSIDTHVPFSSYELCSGDYDIRPITHPTRRQHQIELLSRHVLYCHVVLHQIVQCRVTSCHLSVSYCCHRYETLLLLLLLLSALIIVIIIIMIIIVVTIQ